MSCFAERFGGIGPTLLSESRIRESAGIPAPQGITGSGDHSAIGGVDESNVEQLTKLGLWRVCVIRAIADAADPEQATRRLRAMLTA